MYFTCNTVKKHCIVFKDTASPILRYYFVQKIFQRAVITLLKVMFLLRVQQSVTTSTHSGSTFFSSKNNTVKQMSRAGLKSTMSAACLLAPTYLQHLWIITSVFMKSTGTQGSVISRNAVPLTSWFLIFREDGNGQACTWKNLRTHRHSWYRCQW